MAGIPGYDHDGGLQPHAHVPTEETKSKTLGLICAGVSPEDIALYLNISIPTLYKHYRVELHQKRWDKLQQISDKAYEMALKGDRKMIELVLKHQGNWYAAKSPEDKEKDKQTQTLMEKLIDKL